ncbi:MAG: galactokinase [Verrucomicrobia bacterium]|nr:galactokinase [Verrucomicrobiota bacterium]
MNTDLLRKLDAAFEKHFNARPAVHVRAPGRVNLIGEHTDYNDGFVFPMAIDRACYMAARARSDRRVRIYTVNLDKAGEVSLDDVAVHPGREALWLNFIRAALIEMSAAGLAITGADIAVCSDVPLGGGVSSSAAYESAIGLTLLAVAGAKEPPRAELARMMQRTETRATGVRCGIMDQFASLLSQQDHAILLDCRDLSYKQVPVKLNGHSFVIADTCTPRALASSKYNERRGECEAAAKILAVKSLRSATLAQLQAAEPKMEPNVFKRTRHVVTEIARTQEAAAVFERGDLVAFGKLMDASHESLKNDYEASCRELDVLVAAAWAIPGVLGSRLTGAGWGGCTVTLLRNDAVEKFQRDVTARYEQEIGRKPVIILTGAAQGAQVLT